MNNKTIVPYNPFPSEGSNDDDIIITVESVTPVNNSALVSAIVLVSLAAFVLVAVRGNVAETAVFLPFILKLLECLLKHRPIL